jgi:hypothetical protein
MKIRVQSTPCRIKFLSRKRGRSFQKCKVAFVFYFPLLDKPFFKSVFKHFPKKLRILDTSRLDITETYKYL